MSNVKRHMSATAFRCLVVASIALQLLASGIDALVPSLIPSALSSATEAIPLSPAFESPWFIRFLIAFVAVLYAANIGLLFFKRWARTLSLWGTVVSLGLHPLLGADISSGLATAIQEFSSLLCGAVLALAFFSPLRERFSPAQNDA